MLKSKWASKQLWWGGSIYFAVDDTSVFFSATGGNTVAYKYTMGLNFIHMGYSFVKNGRKEVMGSSFEEI